MPYSRDEYQEVRTALLNDFRKIAEAMDQNPDPNLALSGELRAVATSLIEWDKEGPKPKGGFTNS